MSDLRRRLGRPPGLPRRAGRAAELELADMQGNVVRGYTYLVAAYIVLRIDDVQRARALLTRMLPQVTTGEPWGDAAPPWALQIAFTYAGLERLALPEAVLASFPAEFREGMAARAERLGDRGPSAPESWEAGFGTAAAHVMVTVYAIDEEHLQERRAQLREVGAAQAVTVVAEQRAHTLPGGRDHFGFYDGIAQPAIEGGGVAPRPGDGKLDGRRGWRAVRPGEFVHGYVDEDGALPAAPAPPLHCNGTYMVWRKLHMDVALFRSFVARASEGYPGGEELLAAKIVGRWRDGTPLASSPHAPDTAVSDDPQRINDFTFGDDPEGLRCPVGAHVRRANPRDMEGFFGGRLVNRHRIIRRGRTYGPPLPPGVTEDDGADRGLVFVCFNASIERQFEAIQSLWIDDGDAFGLGRDRDFLVGDPAQGGKMTVPGTPPRFLAPQPRFVTLRGGAYLFRPGIAGLRWLASG